MSALPAARLNQPVESIFADAPAAPMPTTTVQHAPQVVQQVTVTQAPARTDLLVEESDWDWEQLRDYVCGQIIDKFGPFPRNSRKEYGIFTRFIKEYGSSQSAAIAKYAFGPVCNGWWKNAPISITRFCKASDPYFSAPILQAISDLQQQ